MPLSVIEDSLFTRLSATGGLPPLHFDNIKADPPPDDHLRPFILPATPNTLGLNDLGQEIGVFQVSVYAKKGQGTTPAIIIAELILAAFPRNLELTGLRIDKIGAIGVPFYDGDWQITPVSIDYQHLTG